MNGSVADKVSRLVDAADSVAVEGERPRYVGRGGEKLAGALEALGLDPTGASCLDAGASTGGFTDCLLQAGAARVVAVDVGRGQLHERLRADPRVEVNERTDIRQFDAKGRVFDLVVADLSFISLGKVVARLAGLMATTGDLVALVKPQFEAGREEASRGRGVVRDPSVWLRVLDEVSQAASAAGLVAVDGVVSPLRGADGNVEFLVRFRHSNDVGGADLDPAALVAAVVDS